MIAFQIPTSVVERLGWVLVHSAWQFSLIALVAIAIHRVMERCSATARYWTLLVTLAGMVVTPAVTWLNLPTDTPVARVAIVSDQGVQEPSESARPLVDLDPAADAGSDVLVANGAPLAEQPGASGGPIHSGFVRGRWWASVEAGVKPWLRSIVAIWCLGVVTFGLRPLLSWYTVRRLRSVGVSPVPAAVAAMLEHTAERLRLRQAVQILQSTLTRVPVVIGYLRPVILLPASVLTGVPTSQLEAILAHELAHVRRHDFLVNLLQTLVETVFFYHPAVWWLSHRIRVERENCCDDIAVQICGDRVAYSRMLVALEELRTPVSLAMAASGGSLLARIVRLVGGRPTPHTNRSTWWLPSVLAMSTVAALGLSLYVTSPADESPAAIKSATEDDLPSDERRSQETRAERESSANQNNVPHDLDSEPLPAGAIQRFGTARFRVPGWYKIVDFSGDARLVFVKADQRLTVLDRESGRPVKDLRVNPGPGSIWWAAASADGKLVAVSMSDFPQNREQPNHRIVVLNTTSTRRQVLPWNDRRGDVRLLSFSRDNKVLVAGTEQDGLRFWNLDTGEEISKPTWSELWVRSAAFSPDGQTLVVVGWQKSLIWRWQTDEAPRELARQRDDRPLTVKFSPDGKWFAVGYDGVNGLRLFDTASGEFAWQIDSHGKSMYPDGGIAFTSDSRFMAVPVTRANAVELWNLETRQRVHSFESLEPRTVAISRDGNWLVAGGSDSLLNLWSLSTREPAVALPEGHDDYIHEMRFSSDGRILASASDDGTVRVWDVATGKQTQKLSHNAGRMVRGLAVSSDGRLVISSALDNTLGVWDRSTGQRLLTLAGHGQVGGSRAVQFSPDGSRFASWGDDLRLCWWNTSDGKLLATHATKVADAVPPDQDRGFLRELPRGQFSSDGSTLLIEFSAKLFEFDAATGQERRQIPMDDKVVRFALSPDGRWLATVERPPRDPSSDSDRNEVTVTLRKRETREVTHQFNIPGWDIACLAFSPDSRRLAFTRGHDPQPIDIVNVQTGLLSARIPNVAHCVSLQFSPDGKYLASTHIDSTMVLWDLAKFPVNAADGAPAERGSPDIELLRGGKGNVLAPLEGDWVGTLTTGPAPLVIARDAEAGTGWEPFDCVVVDNNTNEPIPGDDLTIHFRFLIPATADAPEKVIDNLVWRPKSGSRFKFLVPERAMQHPHRDQLVVQWGVRHPDYETLSPEEPVSLVQIVRDEPKSARDTFRRIKLQRNKPNTGQSVPEGEARESAPAQRPTTEAEKAVTKLVLVFFQDRSRRTVGGVMLDAGDETLFVTTGPACVVSDGTPHALDRAFLEVAGKSAIEAVYHPESNAELFVYRAAGGLTSYRLQEWYRLNEHGSPVVGDALSAVTPTVNGELRVAPNVARVTALDSKSELKLPDQKVHHRFDRLIEVDRPLPEGTPLFKDGQLAGLTLLGTRFLGKDANKSYVVPTQRIAALFAEIQNHPSGAQEGASRKAQPVSEDRDAAIAAIQKLGGRVSFRNNAVEIVRFSNIDVTDSDLVHLKGLHNLTSLYLPGSNFGDAGLEHLKGMTNLTNLYLTGTKVGDAGLEHLNGMTSLRVLYLDSPRVTDAGLVHLKGLTKLVGLSLNGTKVTNAGLKHLTGMNNLIDLRLNGTEVNDAGLEHLKGLAELAFLFLNGSKVTDAGLEHLKGLTNLQQLHLNETEVSDAGLEHLKALTKLGRLEVTKTKVTDAGVKKLQQALPNCMISHSPRT